LGRLRGLQVENLTACFAGVPVILDLGKNLYANLEVANMEKQWVKI